jgi:peptidoglycan/LPS O-acetylase OafA/YrhL
MRDRAPRVQSGASQEDQGKHVRLIWIELIKAVALVWIFLNHIVERFFGYPYIANPHAGWPPFGERLAQLRPLQGFGIWDIPLNMLRYLGWAGDQGVQFFLIVSGFSLTWGLLARYGDASISLSSFYRRRAERIYPLWWGVHLLFAAAWILIGWGLPLTDPAFYLSLVGIRVTPDLFYYFAPAWWYIGLLLQLYLVYPLLWEGLRRWGPLRLLVACCAVAFIARAFGLLLFTSYVDAWQRGAIFITRLPEFVFGISLAAWLHHAPNRTDVRLRSPSTLLLVLGLYLLGTALSLTLLGMTVAPFLLGVGAFVILYSVLSSSNRLAGRGIGVGAWIGRHSYSLYLLHHPLILLLVPAGLEISGHRALASTAAAALFTVVGALVLEWGVSGTQAILGRWRKDIGLPHTALRIVALGIVVGVLLVSSELVVRWVAPQEVLGWGERPSLEPDPTLGWRLKPSHNTRLRWESYDYYVTANSQGFPGPEYPALKTPETFRILTVGDAFTSAEGVDTDQAWPRLLEAELASRLPDRRVEVLNFAITGYGPNQYAAVVEMFAPIYQPDLILIGFFVNEYQDVLWSDEDFRHSIGFDLPPQDGWYAIASLSNLRQFVDLWLAEPVIELLRNKPSPHGYFLGNFLALERNRPDLQDTGRQLVAERIEQIKSVADEAGAKVAIAMIPAPVCRLDRLDSV